VTDQEIIKKKPAKKRSSEGSIRSSSKSTFPTLGHIVLSNGSRVEIPELPQNISQLTTYDHMRIAAEYAALAICCVNQLELKMTRMSPVKHRYPRLELTRMNLEDLSNHLLYAIEGFHKEKGSS
jgi:nitrogen fixation protein